MSTQDASPSTPSPGKVPVAPSLEPTLEAAEVHTPSALLDRSVVFISVLAIGLGMAAAMIAQMLMALIGFFTNLCFYGKFSIAFNSPADNHLGWWVVLIPVGGGLIVGVMARYGSAAIRGHGIPEAMDSVLTAESRIPPRVTLLKPLSAAIAIGTGGPFGAEGPIIATGGALGSLIGQVLSTSAAERKTLLAAGAAAGMAATFGSPVSAVLMAVELLLFEFRARSLVPVAFAASAAAGVRIFFSGTDPIFAMPAPTPATLPAVVVYIVLGLIVGVAAAGATRGVSLAGDLFKRLPIHWMWWPALGAVVVGVIGVFVPHTLGVGYDNIHWTLSDQLTLQAIGVLALMKWVSWTIALASGTSGGTLAPLFTIGGGLGALLGALATWLLPTLGVDIHIAALVGMAGIFAGASRALLTSIIFAIETTHQPQATVPLLAGCGAAFLVSAFLLRESLMTEPLVRRGVRVPTEYSADPLDQVLVHEVATRAPATLRAADTLGQVRAWLASGRPEAGHQGFPVVDARGHLVGVLTRRNLLDGARPDNQRVGDLVSRPPVVIHDDATVRDAVHHMVDHDVGRLPVVRRQAPDQIVGIITRNDILTAYRRGLAEQVHSPSHLHLPEWTERQLHWRTHWHRVTQRHPPGKKPRR